MRRSFRLIAIGIVLIGVSQWIFAYRRAYTPVWNPWEVRGMAGSRTNLSAEFVVNQLGTYGLYVEGFAGGGVPINNLSGHTGYPCSIQTTLTTTDGRIQTVSTQLLAAYTTGRRTTYRITGLQFQTKGDYRLDVQLDKVPWDAAETDLTLRLEYASHDKDGRLIAEVLARFVFVFCSLLALVVYGIGALLIRNRRRLAGGTAMNTAP